jgi:hypothetical protein
LRSRYDYQFLKLFLQLKIIIIVPVSQTCPVRSRPGRSGRRRPRLDSAATAREIPVAPLGRGY